MSKIKVTNFVDFVHPNPLGLNGWSSQSEGWGILEVGPTSNSEADASELEVLFEDGKMARLDRALSRSLSLSPSGLVDGANRPINALVGFIPAERRWCYE